MCHLLPHCISCDLQTQLDILSINLSRRLLKANHSSNKEPLLTKIARVWDNREIPQSYKEFLANYSLLPVLRLDRRKKISWKLDHYDSNWRKCKNYRKWMKTSEWEWGRWIVVEGRRFCLIYIFCELPAVAIFTIKVSLTWIIILVIGNFLKCHKNFYKKNAEITENLCNQDFVMCCNIWWYFEICGYFYINRAV